MLDAACWGAVIGGAGYTASVAFSDGGFDNWNSGDFWKSVGIGAVSGFVTAGIGNAFGPVGSNGIAGEIGRAMTHAHANTMIGAAFGNEPSITGYGTAFLSSLIGSATHNFKVPGQIAVSGVTGGAFAELSGGDFWRGAATGITISSLNHAAHGIQRRQMVNLQVKATRAFLEDLGYPADQVASDVVGQKDSFFGRYYASIKNFSSYKESFTSGHLDSYSKKYSAFLSVTREFKSEKVLGLRFSERFALKYYPDRAHSIGIIRPGGFHYIESGLEGIDGLIRGITGYDNFLYNMHDSNAYSYLHYTNR